MNIKNYTSTVSPSSSMAKIEEKLVEIGASNINKTYQNKVCIGITFLIFDEQLKQTIAFNVKAQVDECFKIFWAERKQKNDDARKICMDQANKTAWKILSDWCELQCTMILLGQAKPLQMFLPFVYDMAKNETLYDKVVNGSLKLLPASV